MRTHLLAVKKDLMGLHSSYLIVYESETSPSVFNIDKTNEYFSKKPANRLRKIKFSPLDIAFYLQPYFTMTWYVHFWFSSHKAYTNIISRIYRYNILRQLHRTDNASNKII